MRIAWQQCLLPYWLNRHRPALLHAPAYVAPLHVSCPLVLTLYDLHVYTHPQTCRRLNRLHYRAIMPAGIRRAAAIVVPSHHTLKQLRVTFGDAVADRTVVIPLGVSERFRPETDTVKVDCLRRRYALPRRFVLFVGNLAPRKNLPLLIAAWRAARRRQPDLELVLAGQGPPPQAGAGIHCPGYVPLEMLPGLYACAQALVFPSIDEGYGLPVLEALACGCPVICSGGAPSEIAPRAVLSPASTPAALADAILRLETDPGLRRRLVQQGLDAAAERSWATAAQHTLNLYRRVSPAADTRNHSLPAGTAASD